MEPDLLSPPGSNEAMSLPPLAIAVSENPAKAEGLGLNKIQTLITLIPQMYRFQSKVMHHTKKQEDLKLNNKRQSTDANTKMLELL